jgi:hypothetical protein
VPILLTILQGPIYWKIPPLPRGEILADVTWWEKKKQEKKEKNVTEKGRKGKESKKRGSKRVK